MMLPRIGKILQDLENNIQEYHDLNTERLEIERKIRELRTKLHSLKVDIQSAVGVAEQYNIPHVTQIGRYYIIQIRKAREVKAYNYDYVEFNISQEDN